MNVRAFQCKLSSHTERFLCGGLFGGGIASVDARAGFCSDGVFPLGFSDSIGAGERASTSFVCVVASVVSTSLIVAACVTLQRRQ